MSTSRPTEFFSKQRRRLLDQADGLTTPEGIATDISSDTTQADPVVDYECPRPPVPMPTPTVLTAPRGTVPGFGDDAFDLHQLLAPSSSASTNQISDQLNFALEVAKCKPTFIYVAAAPASPAPATTTAPPHPSRSTTFAVPKAPPPPPRRPAGLRRPCPPPAPRTSLSASPASDGSSSDQLSDASTSSGKSITTSSARRYRQRTRDQRGDPNIKLILARLDQIEQRTSAAPSPAQPGAPIPAADTQCPPTLPPAPPAPALPTRTSTQDLAESLPSGAAPLPPSAVHLDSRAASSAAPHDAAPTPSRQLLDFPRGRPRSRDRSSPRRPRADYDSARSSSPRSPGRRRYPALTLPCVSMRGGLSIRLFSSTTWT